MSGYPPKGFKIHEGDKPNKPEMSNAGGGNYHRQLVENISQSQEKVAKANERKEDRKKQITNIQEEIDKRLSGTTSSGQKKEQIIIQSDTNNVSQDSTDSTVVDNLDKTIQHVREERDRARYEVVYESGTSERYEEFQNALELLEKLHFNLSYSRTLEKKEKIILEDLKKQYSESTSLDSNQAKMAIEVIENFNSKDMAQQWDKFCSIAEQERKSSGGPNYRPLLTAMRVINSRMNSYRSTKDVKLGRKQKAEKINKLISFINKAANGVIDDTGKEPTFVHGKDSDHSFEKNEHPQALNEIFRIIDESFGKLKDVNNSANKIRDMIRDQN